MKNEEKTLQILNMFCDKTHCREAFHHPFMQDSSVYATDGYGMIWLPATEIKSLNKLDKPNASNAIPDYKDIEPTIIDVAKMRELIDDMCPRIDEMTDGSVECDRCDGDGFEECDLGHEHECEECDGDGKIDTSTPTGKKIDDPEGLFYDGNGVFTYKQYSRILKVAEILDIKEIKQKHKGFNESYYFEIGAFKALFMPWACHPETIEKATHFRYDY
jgi:hypothetical protein